ncbi:MAG TPA: XdhC/CoxI family protein [Myxococcota bacterium]|nr:XdhC/CoxI family protein [Myxococcota bacterium]HRY91825.1 XdhC/CoxI family protein [Myxococcota bacterium]HSA21471.1 XdhC/CoxI family protein [Myxococcota bacterium]
MQPTSTEGLQLLAREIQRLVEAEEPGVLAVVTSVSGSAPGKVGAKMLVLADGSIRGTVGGGVLEARVISDALNALEDGQGPRTTEYQLAELGMGCGGQMGVYLEPIVAPRRVVIFGAGHVGTAVARVAKLLGCHVTVVDERPEWASRERLPEVDVIATRPFAEHLASQPPTSKDHVIIVTRGHDHDQLVLEGVVHRRPAYVGMIGSRKKVKAALEKLRDLELPAEALEAVHAPIGLDIGAVTPEEIAVAIGAELVWLWRRGAVPEDRRARPLKAKRGAAEG